MDIFIGKMPFPAQPLDGNSSLDYGWKKHPGEGRRDSQGLGTRRVQVLEGFYCSVWGLQFMLVKLWDFFGLFLMVFACGNNAEGPGEPLDRSPPKLSWLFWPQTQLRVRVWGIWVVLGGFGWFLGDSSVALWLVFGVLIGIPRELGQGGAQGGSTQLQEG